MEKIKVLEMIDKPFLGGGQINLLSLAKGLSKDKFDVSVCSRDGGPLVEEVKRLGIDYFPVDFSKRVRGKISKTDDKLKLLYMCVFSDGSSRSFTWTSR